MAGKYGFQPKAKTTKPESEMTEDELWDEYFKQKDAKEQKKTGKGIVHYYYGPQYYQREFTGKKYRVTVSLVQGRETDIDEMEFDTDNEKEAIAKSEEYLKNALTYVNKYMAAHGIWNPTIMYVKVENRKDYKTLLNKGVGLKGKSGNPNETLLIQKG